MLPSFQVKRVSSLISSGGSWLKTAHDTVKKWKELRNMNDEKEINVDKAWNNVFSRMNESGHKTENGHGPG